MTVLTRSVHMIGPYLSFSDPDRLEILAYSKEIDGLRVCDRVPIVVDLFSSGYGRDAAIKFLEFIQKGALENTG